MIGKTYIDEQGYLRFNNSHKLVHRWVAHNEIYLKNRGTYPLSFSKYVVHHIDGNKLHNNSSNLMVITQDDHIAIHGIPMINISGHGGYSVADSPKNKIVGRAILLFIFIMFLCGLWIVWYIGLKLGIWVLSFIISIPIIAYAWNFFKEGI